MVRARSSTGALFLLGGSVAVAAIVTTSPAVAISIYVQNNLVSDVPGLATFTDSDLTNPWGLARSAGSPKSSGSRDSADDAAPTTVCIVLRPNWNRG